MKEDDTLLLNYKHIKMKWLHFFHSSLSSNFLAISRGLYATGDSNVYIVLKIVFNVCSKMTLLDKRSLLNLLIQSINTLWLSSFLINIQYHSVKFLSDLRSLFREPLSGSKKHLSLTLHKTNTILNNHQMQPITPISHGKTPWSHHATIANLISICLC